MFQRRNLDRIEERQQETLAILRTIEAGLIASDPRTPMAAEAYNGLRLQVARAAKERRRMLLQLVAMSDAIERGATVETLRDLCGQWCSEAGLLRIDDAAARPELFDLVEGEAPPREMVAPAWIDADDETLVQKGLAKGGAPEPEPEPRPEAESDPEPEAESEPEPEPQAEADPSGPEAAEQAAPDEDETGKSEGASAPEETDRNDDADESANEEQR